MSEQSDDINSEYQTILEDEIISDIKSIAKVSKPKNSKK